MTNVREVSGPVPRISRGVGAGASLTSFTDMVIDYYLYIRLFLLFWLMLMGIFRFSAVSLALCM